MDCDGQAIELNYMGFCKPPYGYHNGDSEIINKQLISRSRAQCTVYQHCENRTSKNRAEESSFSHDAVQQASAIVEMDICREHAEPDENPRSNHNFVYCRDFAISKMICRSMRFNMPLLFLILVSSVKTRKKVRTRYSQCLEKGVQLFGNISALLDL